MADVQVLCEVKSLSVRKKIKQTKKKINKLPINKLKVLEVHTLFGYINKLIFGNKQH